MTTKKETVKELPEVRQCANPASNHFGAIIIVGGPKHLDWGYFNPNNGGGWFETDDEVPGGLQDWPVLSPPAIITPPADTPS